MSEICEKNVSSLAITEKKPHRAGGCVGIFFQLFDWNRRFAKKKLFSRKLLPPGGSKQGSKKFCGDENLPKLRLIADENSGGFPSVKNEEQKHVLRPPTLVAKLMGLDSMPAERPSKLRNPSPSRKTGADHTGEKSTSNNHIGFHTDEWSLEKRDGSTKQELRPKKLQKTGVSERKQLTKFGTESLQFKNVLSRSKKQYTKLASPVKSPKSLSAGNATRLIGAATKILEPGLQAKKRNKCAITYAKSERHVPVDEAMLSKCPDYYVNEVDSMVKQSSCRNCVHSLPIVDSRPNLEVRPSIFSAYVSDYMDSPQDSKMHMGPSQDSDMSKLKSPISSFDQEEEKVFHKGQDPSEPNWASMPFDQEGQAQRRAMGPQCNSRSDSQCPIRSSDKTNGDMITRFTHRSNAVNEPKDFVALNRTLSGRTRSRTPARSDNFKFDIYPKVGNKGDEILSPVRKRRSMNVSRQSDHFDLNKRKEIQTSCRKDKDVNSFAYSSHVKHRNGICGGTEKRRIQSNSSCNRTPQKNIAKPSPLGRDPLGAILEQKLKELNFQEEEKFGFGGGSLKRTSAMILQELISALNAERPYYRETVVGRSNDHASDMNKNITFQAKPKTPQDSNNLSPGCVLDASFSNDSCVSSSIDDSSGEKLCADFNLLDSATSLSNGKIGNNFTSHLINQVSETLHVLEFADAKSNAIKLAHAKGVILNAELLFRTTALDNSEKTLDFSIVRFLLDELETLASIMRTKCSSFLGFEDTKEENLCKGFIFDCLVEYLESQYGSYVWTRLPVCVNSSEMMISKVVDEVRRWADLAEFVRDDLIEREMSVGLGKWTDFETENFENGAEIGRDIFEGLLDEIVIELSEC